MKKIVVTLSTLVVSLLAGAAHAELTICNNASVQHSLSIAYKDGDNWTSHGWWNIDSGECKVVLGGDLKNRYYYYRATASGRTFSGENYFFCAASSAFDIVGDSDCAGRGYDEVEYRKLDTGKTAKSFTLTLTEPAGSGGDSAATAPTGGGDPINSNGILLGCEIIDGAEFCSIFADGFTMNAFSGSGTPAHIIDRLYNLPENSAVAFEGALSNFTDSTVELVLSSVTPIRDEFASYRTQLEGQWYDVSDSRSTVLFSQTRKEDFYDDQYVAGGAMHIADTCSGSHGDGPAIIVSEDGDPETLCYIIVHIDQLNLTLSYVGGTGQFLEFRKLD